MIYTNFYEFDYEIMERGYITDGGKYFICSTASMTIDDFKIHISKLLSKELITVSIIGAEELSKEVYLARGGRINSPGTKP